MKNSYFLFILFIIISLGSCRVYKEFPVSERVPGAEIKVGLGIDKYENHILVVKTKYLTSTDRLKPSKSYYVVWVKTKNNGVVNVGRLKSTTSKKAVLSTLTPYHPVEVFITAENKPLVNEPKGIEISRLNLVDEEKKASDHQ